MLSKTKKKVIGSFLSAVIIGSLVLPNAASAETKPVSTSIKQTVASSASGKISKRLEEQFKKDDKVTYLIKLKDQVDTKKVAQEAENKAKSRALTAAKTEYQKRSAVVTSLRANAEETQRELKKYLEKQKEIGKADHIQSFYIVNGLAVETSKDVLEKIAALPEVEKILPNETRQLYQSGQKSYAGLPKIEDQKAIPAAEGVEWNIDQIYAPAAWNLGYDGAGTVVASIDTGVQWDHPALKEKYKGYDPAAPDSPNHEYSWFDAVDGQGTPFDDLGHGTHVTGTMVGSEPDGSNKIGVAPGAKWMAVKAFSADGGTDVDLLEAGEWILAPKDAEGNPHPEMAPDVVNNSWGGGPGLDEWYREMVQAWKAAEIFPEFSAGNTTLTNPGGPGSIATPANYPESFATGATDINNNLASFSLQGPSPYGELKPDISAPGVNIRSSVPGSNYEGGWNGTSMAGPHVSAVAALLRQVNANITVEEMEEILIDTALPLTDGTFPESPNNGYGHGLVNAFDAVSALSQGLGTIKGQVTKEGEDTEAPVLHHNPPAEVFEGAEIPLQVTAADNISITSVQLTYKTETTDWTTVEASRVEGDFKNGTYDAVIPPLGGSALQYKWVIKDFGQNVVESEVFDVQILSALTTGYVQNFVNSPVGWTSYGTNNSWEWGKPASGPGTAVSGEKVYVTNLDGTYDNSANMNLQMPPVAVPESGNLFLQFKQWYDLETNYDYGYIYVLPEEEENWVQLASFNGRTSSWIDGEVNLSEYSGQTISVMFNVHTDGSVLKEGWYLDDIKLSDTSIGTAGKKQIGIVEKAQDAASKEKTDEPQVDPKKAKPADRISDKNGGTKEIAPNILPLRAEVSVLETGKSTYSNAGTGLYELTHASGDYTLKAETYGFESSNQSVTVEADGTSTANFVLEELPKGTISGTVTNKATGQPIENATIYLVEDAQVAPVHTNANGEYSLTAYEGSYSVKITAPGFYSSESTTDLTGDVSLDFQLEPFIGYPGEIGYDDASAENAKVFYEAGNGWAVKMSLNEGEDKALVRGGLFRFWDTEWPVPGGTEFAVEVWDATGPNGAPGKKLAGPVIGEAQRNGEWTTVDLSQEGIIVEGDFYLVYIQTKANPDAPGLATDENGPLSERSWQFVGGSWSQTLAEEGNYMIRALVDYEVTPPVITSPEDGTFTKHRQTVIEGTSSPGTTVKIFNGEEEAASVETSEDGTFSKEITLNDGENVITAKVSAENGTTDPSEPVTIVLDQSKPELTITSPSEGDKLNRETVTVTGTAADENLDWVKVNGKKTSVEDGRYSERILLNNGANTIKVVAQDLAGNKVTKNITIDVKYTKPEITNLLPTEDKELKAGESVKIEFNSEPDLDATFVIRMPLTNARAGVQNAIELPLREVSEGKYEGYCTATNTIKAAGAEIEVIVRDDYGNETRKTAEGKLYIHAKMPK
ncbi:MULTISPECIES: S8 family peptidase [Bacillus]|uniref:Bacillopeptidase F n=1 Tax=Bacillus capparidis TaxID=1840411 RepID=A0ABS4CQS7_9BACI|nr:MULTISPECIES: S8 family peptidase [Bacillus]MBP1079926.1 bacillopeptidase F [Bacillus capparidis]MED1095313.1 S8 family serine peptidase [Bacillus capparidis]